MNLIDKNLRHRFHRFSNGFGQIGLGDAFGVDINLTVGEVIPFRGQFFSQRFSANTLRTTRTTENDGKHNHSSYMNEYRNGKRDVRRCFAAIHYACPNG